MCCVLLADVPANGHQRLLIRDQTLLIRNRSEWLEEARWDERTTGPFFFSSAPDADDGNISQREAE